MCPGLQHIVHINTADAVITQSEVSSVYRKCQVSFTRIVSIAVLNNLGGTNNNHHKPQDVLPRIILDQS